ncbi:MAG TPA: HdeD family acid-resistance protein [Geomonas sp.]|nr:HdeD family acid-resistance protein [Geomonas sp.]
MRFSTPHGHDFFHSPSFFHRGFFWKNDLYDRQGVHRGWLAVLGILYLILGIVGFFMATLMTLASVLFFGVLAIIGGVIQIVASFSSQGRRHVWGGILLGALYIIAGLLIVANPIVSSLILTLFLAGALIALGAVRIVYWMEHRNHSFWMWSIISGVVSMVLGILIIAQWPVTGLWVIGLFVALDLLFHGGTALALAFEEKRSLL